MAAARLYRSMHYVTDVVVGAAFGLACILRAVSIVDRAIEKKQIREQS